MKPVLGMYGLVLHYNKFDANYLSPENSETFVQELLKRNKLIEASL